MDKINFTLENGLNYQAEIHKKGELKELTIGDILEAETEAEELRVYGGELKLVRSPARLGLGLLRRQIVSLGAFPMPMTDEAFQILTKTDLMILQSKAAEFDAASYQKVVERGRSQSGTSELLSATE